MAQDQTLKCKDCGADFVWTASEQDFYAQKGFQNSPQRCPDCRAKKKAEMRGSRQSYPATCAQCGAQCTVPFPPKEGRPVYCEKCYKEQPRKTV